MVSSLLYSFILLEVSHQEKNSIIMKDLHDEREEGKREPGRYQRLDLFLQELLDFQEYKMKPNDKETEYMKMKIINSYQKSFLH